MGRWFYTYPVKKKGNKMRKIKKVNIEGKEYEVKELSMRQILELKNQYESVTTFDGLISIFIEKCSNIPKDSLLDLTFSDMESLVVAVKEVNESFFKIPAHLGLKEVADQMIEKIKNSIIKDWKATTESN